MGFWIIAGVAAFLLGMSKGGLPTVAMLTVPLMALYMDPAMAAGLLLPLYMIADVYAVWLFRRAWSPRNIAILAPAAAVGILFGFLSVSVVPGDAVKLLLAVIGLGYLANTWGGRLRKVARPARQADLGRGLVWGALAGFTSYISHAGGPPYQAYVLPQKLDKMVYLGTTAILFIAINAMKLPPYILAGQVDLDSFLRSLRLVPVLLLGAFLGSRVSRWLPERVFYGFVEVGLLLVSLKLLWEVAAPLV